MFLNFSVKRQKAIPGLYNKVYEKSFNEKNIQVLFLSQMKKFIFKFLQNFYIQILRIFFTQFLFNVLKDRKEYFKECNIFINFICLHLVYQLFSEIYKILKGNLLNEYKGTEFFSSRPLLRMKFLFFVILFPHDERVTSLYTYSDS